MREDLIIAYGDKAITLNKGDQHIILDNKEVGFMIQSILNNVPLEIKAK